jgi:hypothetical protein
MVIESWRMNLEGGGGVEESGEGTRVGFCRGKWRKEHIENIGVNGWIILLKWIIKY